MINMGSHPVLRNIVADQFQIMALETFDVYGPVGSYQHEAVVEINPCSTHQFAGDKIIFIENTDIQVRIFLQLLVVSFFQRRFKKFRGMYPLASKQIKYERLPLSLPAALRGLSIAELLQNRKQIVIFCRLRDHEVDIFRGWLDVQEGHCRPAAGDEMDLSSQEAVPLLHHIK